MEEIRKKIERLEQSPEQGNRKPRHFHFKIQYHTTRMIGDGRIDVPIPAVYGSDKNPIDWSRIPAMPDGSKFFIEYPSGTETEASGHREDTE